MYVCGVSAPQTASAADFHDIQITVKLPTNTTTTTNDNNDRKNDTTTTTTTTTTDK